jgi:tetratricopeptide (TPR) repeat protein
MAKETQGPRERKILEMVRELLLSEAAFKEVYEKYKAGHLRFSDVGNWVDDKGQSILYKLKEQCHSVFRHMGKGPVYKNEWLLDLAIGSIFHEAMKLRENIYQIEVYRPKYLQYKLKVGETSYEKDYLQQFERIISRAEQGVSDSMEETRSLFKDAMEQLIDFFKKNVKNDYLPRFLLENQTLLQRVYGLKRVKEIFNTIFKKGFIEAYQLAGQSYLRSEHYDLASHYFSKALKMDPRHRDLQFLLNFSQGMDAYYNNVFPRALSHFEKLLHSRSNRKGEKEYLKKAEGACHNISLELEEGKKPKDARKASFLADQIKKCYSEIKRSL